MNSGLILFNKPSGITSFDALRDIKRALGTGKVGHTGTLDKFASGLLIVLAGKALKLSQWFTHCDKKYEGRIKFGIETDTLDPEGSIIFEAPLPSREAVEKVLNQFTGKIMQVPPAFSAIHINGKRAYELVRSGEAPEMKKREITIYKLELKSWQPPFADIFVHCSSGTYIRSLARDIALAAGSRGHLCELKRTQVGGFVLEETHAEAQRRRDRGDEKKEDEVKLLKIDKNIVVALGMSVIDVNNEEKKYICQGKPLDPIIKDKTFNSSAPPRLCENSSLNPSLAVFEGETLIAVIEMAEGRWKYGCVIN
ncbi:MAG: tRNA pseudouridine(55) synthase TruB [Treponema sp.]|nr:tRNA pseudouridine(55) synthase TruB [Treponema sp.]